MTFETLQNYLDQLKWQDSRTYNRDLCGAYQRCRYCRRDEAYPCAKAHNRLVDVIESGISDVIPEWLIAEPMVASALGEEIATEEVATEDAQAQEEQPAAGEGVSSESVSPVPEPASEEGEGVAASTEEAVAAERDGEMTAASRGTAVGGYIDCRSDERGELRVFTLRKRRS